MSTGKIRSAGITASAALAMMGGLSAFLLWGWLFLPVVQMPPDSQGHTIYQDHLVAFALFALLPPLFVVISIRTSIGLFQLKPWARRSALVMATFGLAFCLVMIAMRPFETFFIPDRFVSEVESLKQLLAVSFVFMLLPISVWWLFFFRLKGVKAQFEG